MSLPDKDITEKHSAEEQTTKLAVSRLGLADRIKPHLIWLISFASLLTVGSIILSIVWGVASYLPNLELRFHKEVQESTKDLHDKINQSVTELGERIGDNSTHIHVIEERVTGLVEDLQKIDKKLDRIIDTQKTQFIPLGRHFPQITRAKY